MWWCLGCWEDWVLLRAQVVVPGSFSLLYPFWACPVGGSCAVGPSIIVESCANILSAAGQRTYLVLQEALCYKEIMSRKFWADSNWLGKFILGSTL